jgi:small-conductance mechanosensitive channel
MGALTRLIQSRILGAAGVERGTQQTVATLLRLGATVLAALMLFQAWGRG